MRVEDPGCEGGGRSMQEVRVESSGEGGGFRG